MIDILILLIVALMIGGAAFYIIRAKKKGVTCIGCSAGSSCSGHCHTQQENSCTGNCNGCHHCSHK